MDAESPGSAKTNYNGPSLTGACLGEAGPTIWEVVNLQLKQEVNHYVVRNIAAMVGMSMYLLIDTLFISIAAGPMGLTALNVALPLFSLFNCLGMLLGVGGSAYYSLNKVNHPERVRSVYSELMVFGIGLGLLITIAIEIFIHPLIYFLGGSPSTYHLEHTYISIIAFCAPLYLANILSINFIRNDNHPSLTMAATLTETTSVIVIDWLFIFGLGLKMEGAAIATLFSPVCSLLVLSRHRHFAQRHLSLFCTKPRLKTVLQSAQLGIAAGVNELTNGFIVFLFNVILLHIAGNYAIAAYGIISNVGLIVVALANGVALGIQPIASREYGVHHYDNVKKAFWQGLKITAGIGLLAFVILTIFRQPVINLFNYQHQASMAKYAMTGVPIYFSGAIFINANILMILFLTSIKSARSAFTMSILRGYLILTPVTMLLGFVVGINGVWAAVPVTELIICVLSAWLIHNRFRNFDEHES